MREYMDVRLGDARVDGRGRTRSVCASRVRRTVWVSNDERASSTNNVYRRDCQEQYRYQGLHLQHRDLGFRISGFGVQISDFGVGYRVVIIDVCLTYITT